MPSRALDLRLVVVDAVARGHGVEHDAQAVAAMRREERWPTRGRRLGRRRTRRCAPRRGSTIATRSAVSTLNIASPACRRTLRARASRTVAARRVPRRSDRDPAGAQPPRAPSELRVTVPRIADACAAYSPRKPAPHADEGAMTDRPAIDRRRSPVRRRCRPRRRRARTRPAVRGRRDDVVPRAEWPEHARHVAVEFVHPVIMGKRALPAVAVADDDPVAASAVARARPATSCAR